MKTINPNIVPYLDKWNKPCYMGVYSNYREDKDNKKIFEYILNPYNIFTTNRIYQLLNIII
jgi:hypothetical protein